MPLQLDEELGGLMDLQHASAGGLKEGSGRMTAPAMQLRSLGHEWATGKWRMDMTIARWVADEREQFVFKAGGTAAGVPVAATQQTAAPAASPAGTPVAESQTAAAAPAAAPDAGCAATDEELERVMGLQLVSTGEDDPRDQDGAAADEDTANGAPELFTEAAAGARAPQRRRVSYRSWAPGQGDSSSEEEDDESAPQRRAAAPARMPERMPERMPPPEPRPAPRPAPPEPRPAPPPRPASDDFVPVTALLVGGALPFNYAVSLEWVAARRKEAYRREYFGAYGKVPGPGEFWRRRRRIVFRRPSDMRRRDREVATQAVGQDLVGYEAAPRRAAAEHRELRRRWGGRHLRRQRLRGQARAPRTSRSTWASRRRGRPRAGSSASATLRSATSRGGRPSTTRSSSRRRARW